MAAAFELTEHDSPVDGTGNLNALENSRIPYPGQSLIFYSPMALQQARHQSETDADTPERQTAIDAEDVHVTYDDGTEAVRGVSLDVEDGGFLAPHSSL